MSLDDAREALTEYLHYLATSGATTVSPSQLVDLRQQIGRTPTWLTRELQRRVAEGSLEPHPKHGLYTLRAPIPA